MMDLETILTSILIGLFAGLGSTIGNYLATKHIIKNLERVEKAVREKTSHNGKG